MHFLVFFMMPYLEEKKVHIKVRQKIPKTSSAYFLKATTQPLAHYAIIRMATYFIRITSASWKQ